MRMEGWTWWRFVLWGVVGYIAVGVLVRLMRQRRAELEAELRQRTHSAQPGTSASASSDSQRLV